MTSPEPDSLSLELAALRVAWDSGNLGQGEYLERLLALVAPSTVRHALMTAPDAVRQYAHEYIAIMATADPGDVFRLGRGPQPTLDESTAFVGRMKALHEALSR